MLYCAYMHVLYVLLGLNRYCLPNATQVQGRLTNIIKSVCQLSCVKGMFVRGNLQGIKYNLTKIKLEYNNYFDSA